MKLLAFIETYFLLLWTFHHQTQQLMLVDLYLLIPSISNQRILKREEVWKIGLIQPLHFLDGKLSPQLEINLPKVTQLMICLELEAMCSSHFWVLRLFFLESKFKDLLVPSSLVFIGSTPYPFPSCHKWTHILNIALLLGPRASSVPASDWALGFALPLPDIFPTPPSR